MKYLLLILSILSIKLYSQNFEYTIIDKEGSYNKSISGILNSGIVWLSLNDICTQLSLSCNDDKNLLKKELFFENGSAIFAAYNSFVVVKRIHNENYVHQMFAETIIKNKNLYLPEKEFLTIYKRLSNKNIVPKNEYKATDKKETITQTDIPKPIPNINFNINDYTIDSKSNGYVLRLLTNKSIKKISKLIKGKYLYLNFPNASIDTDRFFKKFEAGLILEIQSKQNGKDASIKTYLKYNVTNEDIEITQTGNYINILFFMKPETMKKLKEEEERLKKTQLNKSFDIIVIDAGHGGKDPGAIGLSKTKEKDINLAIALKVGNLINKRFNDKKVVYTRDDDTFIELYRRGQIANENKGDLFISIHSNSTAKKPGDLSGAEIYLLRPGRTEESIRIAEIENSVIKLESDYEERYKDLTDENFILVAMSQTQNVKNSEKYAEILNNKFSDKLRIQNRGVKQAGFYVLVGASMPSVLIESGYLNHPEDERYLKTEDGQNEIANAIVEAITEYENYFENLIN